MAENCCTTAVPIMILACAGGSNVGQLSNQAAVELTEEGLGKLFCLAGIGANLSGFVQSARDIAQLVGTRRLRDRLRQGDLGTDRSPTEGLRGDYRPGHPKKQKSEPDSR